MAQEKKQSFMLGAAILTASTLIVKILGLLFSIPLANLIEPESMSYFNVAYDIFGVFLMLSTAGLPIAVSRMVGTACAQGRRREADQVFSVAFWLFFGIGLAGCLIMFFGAGQIAVWYGSPGAKFAIMALAPTMFFISVMSALRGYFQGRSNMTPTAVSQTIEAVTKVLIGVGLAVFILRTYQSHDMAAVGAIIGVSVSAGLGTLYLVLYKLRQRRLDRREAPDEEAERVTASRKEMLLSLIRFAVPITLGSCFLSVLDMVDGAILFDRLKLGLGMTQEMADWWNGVRGHARKFFDLPGAFVVPISTSLLPVLSGAIANRDQKSIDHISSISLRVTFLISIPSSVGMCLFADPICRLLLAGKPGAAEGTAPLLAMLSVAIAFNSTLFTTNAILQSFGHATIPVVNMAVGGVVKLVLSYVLIGIPQIGTMGSAISTVISYFLIMVLNFIALRKCLPRVGRILATSLPILLASAVMGAVSYGIYRGLSCFISVRLAVLPAILAALAVYGVCVVLFRGVTYDDVVLLPKGAALAKLLHVRKEPRHARHD